MRNRLTTSLETFSMNSSNAQAALPLEQPFSSEPLPDLSNQHLGIFYYYWERLDGSTPYSYFSVRIPPRTHLSVTYFYLGNLNDSDPWSCNIVISSTGDSMHISDYPSFKFFLRNYATGVKNISNEE